MKNLFNDISQDEKNRILEMHSGKKNVVSEQVTAAGVGTGMAAGAVGGPIGAAIGGLIAAGIQIANGGGTSDQKVKALCNLCKTSKTQVTQTGNRMADAIRDSVQGMGTNEKQINNVFTSLRSFDDFCSLVRAYQSSYSVDLYSDLDADIDSEQEWVVIFRPIRDLLLKAKQQVVKPTPQTTRPVTPQAGQGTRPTSQPGPNLARQQSQQPGPNLARR